MKKTLQEIIQTAALFIAATSLAQMSTNGLQLVPPDQLPKSGTFYYAKGPTGHPTAPLPCPPRDIDAPIYALGNGHFLIDDSSVDWGAVGSRRTLLSATSQSRPSPLDDPTPSYSTAMLNWTLPLFWSSLMTPAVAPDGTIYVSYEVGLSAVNPDMSIKWAWEPYALDLVAYGAPIVGPDGTIYVACGGPSPPSVSAVDPTDGSIIWSCNVAALSWDMFWDNTPSLAPDGTIYIGYGPNFYAITNGAVKWARDFTNTYTFDEEAGSAIGPDGTIYIAKVDACLLALRPDGSTKWTADPHEGFGSGGMCPAVGADGTIYFGTEIALYAVRANGSFKWTNSVPNQSWWWSPEIGQDGTVYAQAWHYPSNTLYALNPTSGAVKWAFELSTVSYRYPAIAKCSVCAIASDGEIYVSDGDGSLYSLGLDGTMISSNNMGVGALQTPVFGPGGTLYVAGTDSGVLFGFTNAAPVACAPWPQYMKNSRHTAAVTTNDLAHLSSASMQTNGFRFTLTAATNSVECVCATRDFATWTNVGQVVLTNANTANFLDSDATNYQYRFYKAYPQ